MFNILSFVDNILGLIFPLACVCCGKNISKRPLICSICIDKLSVLTDSVCYSCGVPSVNGDKKCGVCIRLTENSDTVVGMRSAFAYEGSAIKLIRCLKYKDSFNIVDIMVPYLAEVYHKHFSNIDVIVGVPMDSASEARRMYNQSGAIAKSLAGTLGVAFIHNLCSKIKKTPSQASLKREERLTNLRDAFVLNTKYKDICKNKNIVIVDDVITTGATVREVAKAIKTQVPSCKVFGLSFARSLR